MKTIQLTVTLMFLVVLNCKVYAASEWQPAIKKNGIDAYSRRVEGTNILEIRAITVVDARMEVIAEVLRDIPANVEWRPKCVECRLLERHNRNAMTTYTRIDLPWPVSDRDVIIKADTSINLKTGRAVVSLGAVDHHKAPPPNENVRITEFFSQYYLEYINREQTGIIFTTRVNPAGRIPTFLVNMFNKRFAYEEMLGLTQMVQKRNTSKLENVLKIEKPLKTCLKVPKVFDVFLGLDWILLLRIKNLSIC
ncbi:MAG: Lipid-binding START domain protein [Candidatus Magnetoglobus multicellularis str. Araruama]|uniref:Lipid-binding START domain protein n=1 Tax=Candidatus Magnetoglobus multicellularis str. Araruama TaxID=890399 RepID=A0A1V1PFS1_9BACT|nr:MAG: Lipid-binding START domain protein [Candidatus Magnetoglobus multicellularis str. Araruama]